MCDQSTVRNLPQDGAGVRSDVHRVEVHTWGAEWTLQGEVQASACSVVDGWLVTEASSMPGQGKSIRLRRSADACGTWNILSREARLGSVRRCNRITDNDRAVLTGVDGVAQLALRSDGPTGIHAVRFDGRPVFVASAVRVGLGGSADNGGRSQEMTDVGLELIRLDYDTPLGILGLMSLLVVSLVSPGAYRRITTAA